MRKVGRQTLMLEAAAGNPRNGEGAFIRLKNGAIMYAYSRYGDISNDDHAPAEAAAVFSADEGETWSGCRILFPRENGAANNMCISLLRMNSGDIGLFYLCKYYDGSVVKSKVQLRRSSDEGLSWSEPVTCVDDDCYYVLENDRITRLKSGRIIIPLNRHPSGSDGAIGAKGTAVFYYSDDEKHWLDSGCAITLDAPSGLQETGIYEKTDGRLWAFSRTDRGRQYDCFSGDGGKTFSEPKPNETFTSPCSPMAVKRMTGFSAAVFNPVAFPAENPFSGRTWGRTPLILAVSRDEFNSACFYALEDDPENGYCYTALFEGSDYFLAAYYHSNNGKNVLTSNKILKVSFTELFSPENRSL